MKVCLSIFHSAYLMIIFIFNDTETISKFINNIFYSKCIAMWNHVFYVDFYWRKWHVIPCHPGGHLQANVSTRSTHVPPLLHVNKSHWPSPRGRATYKYNKSHKIHSKVLSILWFFYQVIDWRFFFRCATNFRWQRYLSDKHFIFLLPNMSTHLLIMWPLLEFSVE